MKNQLDVFKDNSSREAYRLLHYLASVPITIPVMRIVQNYVADSPSIDSMSEVLGSGLVILTPNGIDIPDCARIELYQNLPRSEFKKINEKVWKYASKKHRTLTFDDVLCGNLPRMSQEEKQFFLRWRKIVSTLDMERYFCPA